MDIYYIWKYSTCWEIPGNLWEMCGPSGKDTIGTDHNLLFKGEEQVEIYFIAHHEWIAQQCNEPSSEFVENNSLKKTIDSASSVV